MKRALEHTMDGGRPGRQDSALGPARRVGDVEDRDGQPRLDPPEHAPGQGSTTASPRPRPRKVTSASKCGSTRAIILKTEGSTDAHDAQAGQVPKKPKRPRKR
jgi:hypothetical protein